MNLNSVDTARDLSQRIAKHTEETILAGLNDLIKRGLLIVEMGPMDFFHDPASMGIKIQQKCVLKLKNIEYIEALETENAKLKKQLSVFRDLLKDANNL